MRSDRINAILLKKNELQTVLSEHKVSRAEIHSIKAELRSQLKKLYLSLNKYLITRFPADLFAPCQNGDNEKGSLPTLAEVLNASCFTADVEPDGVERSTLHDRLVEEYRRIFPNEEKTPIFKRLPTVFFDLGARLQVFIGQLAPDRGEEPLAIILPEGLETLEAALEYQRVFEGYSHHAFCLALNRLKSATENFAYPFSFLAEASKNLIEAAKLHYKKGDTQLVLLIETLNKAATVMEDPMKNRGCVQDLLRAIPNLSGESRPQRKYLGISLLFLSLAALTVTFSLSCLTAGLALPLFLGALLGTALIYQSREKGIAAALRQFSPLYSPPSSPEAPGSLECVGLVQK